MKNELLHKGLFEGGRLNQEEGAKSRTYCNTASVIFDQSSLVYTIYYFTPPFDVHFVGLHIALFECNTVKPLYRGHAL